MNASDPRTDAARDARPRLREENAGGAQASDFRDHQYGRRVEADRSRTVYHVFTGIPAHVNGASVIGLSRSEATKSMLSLNFCNSERRRERIAARFFAAPETPADQS
ncbi:MAG: hypothetical protein E5X80_08545 [Mesorhizobium sp.]|uniref:hypothetical protein n=1 Tax=Mesorhizobium sp. TaxID=1871066 RepID=UPI000FEA1ABF|nr:hypothetical protein [Mesorhizobium sp.]RWM06932.1 MAG: hypothetical protein EOR71_17750 [Mesorhizobium sp.]TIO53916.1 MAG: hypothetical protein E5X78_06085 [Mesorhizobium sp.]TIO61543.1 MAG: hypothetical protein E5X79_07230 [Mesorhizobium sp.]TJV65929.1 MAG: hypothetical protein E5X80_08545 [Mesorhizobium sp.]